MSRAGCWTSLADDLNVGYLHRMRTGRPWVRCKIAASLDGRTALENGRQPLDYGSGRARLDVHRCGPAAPPS